MGFYAGRKIGRYYVPMLGLDFKKVKDLTGTGGQSNYAGSGVMDALINIGRKGAPKLCYGPSGYAGIQIHLTQNKAMTHAAHVLKGLYITANHGNVDSSNGGVTGFGVYARNASGGNNSGGYLRGGLIMLYQASGSKFKYKCGLHIDVLDLATSCYSGGGTQGILLQMNAASIVNNQVDCILINQNSAQYAFSGITFKGKIGALSGNGAVLNFVGSGDNGNNEGNKAILFKLRSGGATYTVTPAQFLTALGGNCSAI